MGLESFPIIVTTWGHRCRERIPPGPMFLGISARAVPAMRCFHNGKRPPLRVIFGAGPDPAAGCQAICLATEGAAPPLDSLQTPGVVSRALTVEPKLHDHTKVMRLYVRCKKLRGFPTYIPYGPWDGEWVQDETGAGFTMLTPPPRLVGAGVGTHSPPVPITPPLARVDLNSVEWR